MRTALVSTAVLVLLIGALAYGIDSHWSTHAVESRDTKQSFRLNADLNVPATDPPGVQRAKPLRVAIGPAVEIENKEGAHNGEFDGEQDTRNSVRAEATRAIRQVYSLLLEDLGLPSEKKKALMAQLIEDRMARTSTSYSLGKAMKEDERTKRIATIIGNPKTEELLALERKIPAYAEAARIESMLRQNGEPLRDGQIEEVLDILVTVKRLYPETPRSDVKPRSIEALEQTLSAQDERERLVLEQIPRVLSSRQVQYVFDQYQYRSENRARALEFQKKRRIDRPGENHPLWYPATQ